MNPHCCFSTIVGSCYWLYIFSIPKDWPFVLDNLLGKTKFSLSIFKNSEKLCSITNDMFFWNSEAGNNGSHYKFQFTMLTLHSSVFFQENNAFDCLKNRILYGWCRFWISMQLWAAKQHFHTWKLAVFLLACSKLLLYQQIKRFKKSTFKWVA